MFVRFKKHSGSQKHSVLICESYREGKKIEQRIVSFLGAASEPEKLEKLRAEGEAFIAEVKAARANPVVPKNRECALSLNTYEIARKNVGLRDTLGVLYDELGFNHILRGKKVSKVLKSVVLTRFAEPSSKRKACSILERRFKEEITSDAIYYMMDQLAKSGDISQQLVFKATREATGATISLVLFDVTTLHFETIAEDELKAFGFSKDFRFNTTQIVLALATTEKGLPVGYRLFSGNTAEVSTLIQCVDYWKKTLSIGKVIMIGDRAMMSEENVKQLDAAGFQYIIAYPMKKSSMHIKSQILSHEQYEADVIQNELHWRKEIALRPDQRLIVTYNQKRHARDQRERGRLIERIKKKLGKTKNAKKLVSNLGYLKYTTIDNECVAELNENKIAEDSLWDGLHGILTNTDLSAKDAVERYKKLWVIEEAFRINKSHLKMRPIYHYTPTRIKAHIEICFLTFALTRHAQHRLKQAGTVMSVDELREELSPIEASILCDRETGKLYRMPAQMTVQAREIYRILGRSENLVIQCVGRQELPANIKMLN